EDFETNVVVRGVGALTQERCSLRPGACHPGIIECFFGHEPHPAGKETAGPAGGSHSAPLVAVRRVRVVGELGSIKVGDSVRKLSLRESQSLIGAPRGLPVNRRDWGI